MLGNLLKPEFEELIRPKDWDSLREAFTEMDPADIAEVIEDSARQGQRRALPAAAAGHGGAGLRVPAARPADELVSTLGNEQLKNLLNEMAPDDRTRLLRGAARGGHPARAHHAVARGAEGRAASCSGYPEGSAGRYMTPEYLALRPDMTAAEALEYVRTHGAGPRDAQRRLRHRRAGHAARRRAPGRAGARRRRTRRSRTSTTGSWSASPPPRTGEEVVGLFEKYDRVALPVTDSQGVLLGIITVDDVLDVAEEEATEDIQKHGRHGGPRGALPGHRLLGDDASKRGGLAGGALPRRDAHRHGHGATSRTRSPQAVVLALFVPLIITSGGNSGSQATSLIIRSLALRELAPARLVARGCGARALSGSPWACSSGVHRLRCASSSGRRASALYGPHYAAGGASTVGAQPDGRGDVRDARAARCCRSCCARLGLDPATASAPFVATLVDVTGLVIYFTVASAILAGRAF